MVRARVPNADRAIFSVHCHDDLGMAVANSIAGVMGGVNPQPEHPIVNRFCAIARAFF